MGNERVENEEEWWREEREVDGGSGAAEIGRDREGSLASEREWAVEGRWSENENEDIGKN